MTASELMAQLEADPDWVAKRAAREQEFDRLGDERNRALEPVTVELCAAGFDVESPWDLYLHKPYDRAIPILVRHLKDPSYDETARAAIARALAVPEARGMWLDLVDLYRRTDRQQDQLKQALAAAIAVTAERSVANELITLLFDADLGSSRVLLLSALTRLRLPNTWPLITAALSDADLDQEAARMLHQRELRARRKRSRG
jgi:hypothetical protein